MKRAFLICVIVVLCILVAVSGNLTLVNSNGVLKRDIDEISKKPQFHIMVDISDRRLFLLKNGVIQKSYPIAVGNQENPSPIGNWRINKKSKTADHQIKCWLDLNVPWGRYSIVSSSNSGSGNKQFDDGSIKLFDDDMIELYYSVDNEATVYVYDTEHENMLEYDSIDPGDKGAMVYQVEKRLRNLGYFVGKYDGIYDDDLEKAIHKFQQKNGMKESDQVEYTFFKKLGLLVMER